MKEAPLAVDVNRACRWLLGVLPSTDPLGNRLHRHALDLLEHTVLALQGFETDHAIEEADRSLARLRAVLRLAHDLERLDGRQLLHISKELNQIGRQLGGWQRRRARDTPGVRH